MKLRSVSFSFVLLALFACDDEAPTYSNASERGAIDRLSGTWESDDGTVSLTICEDTSHTAAASPDGDDCNSTVYWLQSGGGKRVGENPGGCGGCGYFIGAAFVGELTKDGKTVSFETIASYGDDDGSPDAPTFPVDAARSYGTLTDGGLELRTTHDLQYGGVTSELTTLKRTDADACRVN